MTAETPAKIKKMKKKKIKGVKGEENEAVKDETTVLKPEKIKMKLKRKISKANEGQEQPSLEENDGSQPPSGKKPKREKKKKKKGKKNGEGVEHVHETKGQNKALRYLKDWDLSQSSSDGVWKFEKCRQIWLLQNVYNAQRIPDDHFDILLKYICSIKGRMRNMAKGR